jgi:hypothetical protein
MKSDTKENRIEEERRKDCFYYVLHNEDFCDDEYSDSDNTKITNFSKNCL